MNCKCVGLVTLCVVFVGGFIAWFTVSRISLAQQKGMHDSLDRLKHFRKKYKREITIKEFLEYTKKYLPQMCAATEIIDSESAILHLAFADMVQLSKENCPYKDCVSQLGEKLENGFRCNPTCKFYQTCFVEISKVLLEVSS